MVVNYGLIGKYFKINISKLDNVATFVNLAPSGSVMKIDISFGSHCCLEGVVIASDYIDLSCSDQTVGWMFWDLNLSRVKRLLFPKNIQTGCGAHTVEIRSSFCWSKAGGA
jgi:hypothetical protein